VAVVSTPDDKWGERPKAFVELAAGRQATEEEIIAFARERLPGYMRPDAVEFTELGRTATGKVQKEPLRDREWAGRTGKVGWPGSPRSRPDRFVVQAEAPYRGGSI
jgi:fatty-acyl-CoA synthase